MKIDTNILFVFSEYVLKLILCMSFSFNFLPNLKEPKYDDKSSENPLKRLHELMNSSSYASAKLSLVAGFPLDSLAKS